MAGKGHFFVYRPKGVTVATVKKVEPEIPTLPNGPIVLPGYNKLSESLRKKTPSAVACLAFCGGRKCRFDTTDRWTAEDMAIDGLYSHWVTDDILATSRPNQLEEKDIVGQFIRSGIKTIINLQTSGEHSHCGPPLTSSGFSYLPESFMERDIYYYNFAWKDYEHGTLRGLLNAVKVLSFAVTQGKVAVHCHAGLGRTGVLLCCYLIYSQRIKSAEAIRLIRRKRPNAVQTSGQIAMIEEFDQFLLNCSNVFCISSLDSIKKANDAKSNKQPFTLRHYLEDQKEILHGYEARALRYIPKIVYVICERLLFLCRADRSPKLNFWLDESRPPFTRSFRCFVIDEPRRLTYRTIGQQKWDTMDDLRVQEEKEDDADIYQIKSFGQMNLCTIEITNDDTQIQLEEVEKSLLANPSEDLFANSAIKEYCLTLDGRQSAWKNLSSEKDPQILAGLLWHWFIHLKTPVLTNAELSEVVVYANKPDICFSRFEQTTRYTIEYLLRFVQRLSPCPISCDTRKNLLSRLASILTQQAVAIDGIFFPGDGRKRLGQATLTELLKFFNSTIESFDIQSIDDDDTMTNLSSPVQAESEFLY